MSRIIVIEDNADLREEVLFQLRHAGHQAEGVADATAFDALKGMTDWDIAIIDIGLPGEDGLSIARRIREDSMMGLIMVTARGTLDDRVRGLGDGADAYLVKPVEMRELLAVVSSVERRLAGAPSAAAAGAWLLDVAHRELRSPDGKAVALTETEFRLMGAMAWAFPEVATRKALAGALGEEDFLNFDERRLEAAISRLRRKLESEVGESPLRSARGRGYVFAAPVRILEPR